LRGTSGYSAEDPSAKDQSRSARQLQQVPELGRRRLAHLRLWPCFARMVSRGGGPKRGNEISRWLVYDQYVPFVLFVPPFRFPPLRSREFVLLLGQQLRAPVACAVRPGRRSKLISARGTIIFATAEAPFPSRPVYSAGRRAVEALGPHQCPRKKRYSFCVSLRAGIPQQKLLSSP